MAIQDAETRGSQLLRQIIRKPVVVEFTGMSASSIDREEHRGKFPKRVVLSPKAVGWYADEVAAWINSRRRGFTEAPTAANAARRKPSPDEIHRAAKNHKQPPRTPAAKIRDAVEHARRSNASAQSKGTT